MPAQTRLIANRYQVEEEFIGQGGMGTVYMGRDVRSETPVAVKLLKPEVLQHDPDIVRRFQLEGEALRKLNHPNIVKMLASEQQGDLHYLVMEYVQGGSLLDLLEETPKLSMQRTLYIALDLADALTRAHRLDILHRDIKPANVLIAEDGTPRLTDFGMARVGDTQVTQSGMVVGTLSYISPEALHGESLDARTDIWAFGVMLFEMLTGERPFPERDPGPLITSIMTKPIPDLETLRPEAPTALVDLVYRMLQKDRHARIPSVRLIGAELESIIRGNTSSMQAVVADTSGRFNTPTPQPAEADAPQTVVLPARNNLPSPPTAFVGRDSELSELDKLIEDSEVRLITLLGPGGIGKTRIAIASAERHTDKFEDGVFFVPLAPVEDTEVIVSTIAEHLHFAFGGSEPPQVQLRQYLSEKNLMIVVDNFEHLASGADIIGDILSNASNVTIIITSRERLRLRGEHLYEIDHMILPPKGASDERLAEYPATELFLHSAHRVAPDFEITESNASDVCKIINLVYGLPLGIELAAGWLEMLSVEEIADEIEQSIDFLETDLRDVPERHRSLRAVFDYSWNLLSDDEREILLKLSVFRGGFVREAAQKIANASLRSLTSLVNKSFLVRQPNGRYQTQNLLHQYAEAQLNDDSMRYEMAKAHADYYCNFAKKLESVFNTKNEISALDKIDEELDNIRAAWHWAVNEKQWDALDQVLHPMMLFYQGRSMLRESVRVFSELCDALTADGQGNTRVYWRSRLREVWLAGRLGDYERVWEQAQLASDFFEANGNPIEQSYALNNVSYAQMMMGLYSDSAETARQALERSPKPEDGDVNLTAWFFSMGNLGYAEYLIGNYDEARKIYEQTLTTPEDKASPSGRAFGYNNLGEISREMGDLNHAQDLFQKAYDIFNQYRQLRGMGFSLNNLGGVMFRMGNYVGAHNIFQKAYDLYREIGDKAGMGHALSTLGNSAMNTGDYEEAEKCYQESLNIRETLGNQREIADSLTDLAHVNFNMGNLEKAEKYHAEGMHIRKTIGDRPGLAYSLMGLGMAHQSKGDLVEAERTFREALTLAQEIQNQFVVAQSLAGLGDAVLQQGRFDEAKSYLHQGFELVNRLQSLEMALYLLVSYADLCLMTGDAEEALVLVSQVLQYPAGYITMLMNKAESIRDQAIAKLPADVAGRAIETGRSMDLEAYIQQIVAS